MACQTESGSPTSDVVSTIPWANEESLEYVLLGSDGNQEATARLSIDAAGDTTTFTAYFESETHTDTITTVTDSETLKPISVKREATGETPEDDTLLEVEYTEEGAFIRVGERQSGISVGEHSYENETSLFLWRTIDFAEDYEASYTSVITNHRDDARVYLRVTGKETVTVPAGDFDTWRLEIIASNARQIAWIADTPERTLVRYDNDRGLVFELVTPP